MSLGICIVVGRLRGTKALKALHLGNDAVTAQAAYDAADASYDLVQLYVRPIERRHRCPVPPVAVTPPGPPPSSTPPASIPERGRRGR